MIVKKNDEYKKHTWANFCGRSRALEEAQILVKQINEPDKFKGAARAPDNLLFIGPPGVGKSKLLKTIAYESDCICFKVTASFLQGPREQWDALFAYANSCNKKVLIIIDEVDSVFSTSAKCRTSNVQQQWEGPDSFPNVIVMGATNYFDRLPPPIRSRFTNVIEVCDLDSDTQRGIIRAALK